MAKSKTATRVPVSKTKQIPQSSPALNIAEQAFPLSFISLPEFIAFAILCLTLVAAPYGLSGFWLASLDIFGGESYQPLATLLAVTACVCLLLAVRNYRAVENGSSNIQNRSSNLIGYLLGAFFLWCCITATTAVYLHDALIELVRIGGCLAWFTIARTLLKRDSIPLDSASSSNDNATRHFTQRRFWVLHGIIGSALLVCMIALAGFVNAIRYHEEPRQFSTFFNPNLFANFCAMALPLSLAWSLYLVRLTNRKWLTLPSGLVASLSFAIPLIIVLGLLVSGSKGGLLAMLVGMLVFGIALWRAQSQRIKTLVRAHFKTVAAVAVVLLVVGGAVLVKSILPRLLAANSTEDHSTMFRYYTWIGTTHMIAARPLLGWGPGNFSWAYPPFEITHYVMTAHQVWLQIAAENGVPALLLLLITLGVAGMRGWRALRGDDWPIAASGLGTIAAFIAHGFTDSGWSMTSIVLLLTITLALLDTTPTESTTPDAEKTVDNSSSISHSSSLSWPWVGASLVIALAAAGMQRAVSAENANYDSHQHVLKGALTVSLPPAIEATQTDPLSARAWFNLARIQDALGQDAQRAFERTTQLQPTRAANWMHWAQAVARKGDINKAHEFFNRAVTVDPNGTGIRLARAQWLLSRSDAKDQAQGWKDLEHIAWLATQPYGRFPATPEFVNLDFARAYVKLAERGLQQGKKAESRTLVERGLKDIARARKYESYQRLLAQEGGLANMRPAEDLDELESSLNPLKEQTR